MSILVMILLFALSSCDESVIPPGGIGTRIGPDEPEPTLRTTEARNDGSYPDTDAATTVSRPTPAAKEVRNVATDPVLDKPPIELGDDSQEVLIGKQPDDRCEVDEETYRNQERSFRCRFTPRKSAGISLHFKQFETEPDYDFVYFYDQDQTLLALYHGKLGEFWTEEFSATELVLRFISDGSITANGFVVDKYRYRATTDSALKTKQGYSSSPIRLESAHHISLGPGEKRKERFVIDQPGAEAIDLHFARMNFDLACLLPACQVWIRIFDRFEREIVVFSGRTDRRDFWLDEPVQGDRATIEYSISTTPYIGGVANEYGFMVDAIATKGGNPKRFLSYYPIVLHHGFGGFDSVLTVDYYFGVKAELTRLGYEVYTTEVSANGTLQTRTKQLAEQIDAILEKSSQRNGYKVEKVNLIGHSMGGLDARLLVSRNTVGLTESEDERSSLKGMNYGGKIATIVTIASPHWGSRIADIALGYADGPLLKAGGWFLDLAAQAYNETGSSENDILRAAYNLSERAMSQFAIDHPEPTDLGIIYRTYTGVSQSPWPRKADSDEIDLNLLATFEMLLADPDPSRRANDGFVPLWSAKWKDEYYSTYRDAPLIADHYNQVGQILGMTDPDFDHLDFFRHLAETITADNERIQ